MAYSSLIKSDQVIKWCELCSEDKSKWRCLDCKMRFCEKCKTSHKKVPVTAKHQLVMLRATPHQDVQRKFIIENIPCQDHITKINCLYCKTCDSLVCPDCVLNSHKKHKFIEIKKALDDKLENLKGLRVKVIDKLKFCDSKTSHIQNLIPKCNSIFNESLTKIKQREQELKEKITDCSRVLQDKVHEEKSKVETTVTKVQHEVNSTKKNLEHLKKKLDSAITSNKGQVILNTPLTEPVVKFDPLPQTIENFTCKPKTAPQIQEVFGLFKKVTIPSVQAELGFKVQRTFRTNLPSIRKMIIFEETSAWVSSRKFSKSGIRKINLQGNNILTTTTLSLEINDMDLTADDSILATVSDTSDIKFVSRSGQITSFQTVAPLLPHGIHVTSDNKVLVGVVKSGDLHTDKRDRAIIVFNMEGQQRNVYQYYDNKKRLFTLPYRIKSNIDRGDIFVIDMTSENTGRVISLDNVGNLRWIYEGHPKINDAKNLNPMDIEATAAGYIIVSDFPTHALHVLSQDGDILTYKVMPDLGIKYPRGLYMDKKGTLWVGCGTGGKHSGAKLHMVKLLI